MRKRYTVRNGEIVEVTDEAAPSARVEIVGDRHYDGLRATDGADISTRSKHREYMKRNGLTTMDDFKDTWTRELKLRAERPAHDPSRKQDVADVVMGHRPLSKRPRGREGDPL